VVEGVATLQLLGQLVVQFVGMRIAFCVGMWLGISSGLKRFVCGMVGPAVRPFYLRGVIL